MSDLARRVRIVIVTCLIVVATIATLAVPTLGEEQAMMLPADPAPLIAETSFGPRRFTVEIADDDVERARGLMFRRSMPDDRGMLFVFDETRPVGFWMRNTPMPLDLVFIDENGVVRAILPGEPFSEATISPGPGVPVRFVLELKRGTAAAAGIREGTRLEHPVIDAAAG